MQEGKIPERKIKNPTPHVYDLDKALSGSGDLETVLREAASVPESDSIEEQIDRKIRQPEKVFNAEDTGESAEDLMQASLRAVEGVEQKKKVYRDALEVFRTEMLAHFPAHQQAEAMKAAEKLITDREERRRMEAFWVQYPTKEESKPVSESGKVAQQIMDEVMKRLKETN